MPEPVQRLALGTAQFGFDYGVTNQTGQVGPDEIDAILAMAATNGIDTLDTAALYGDSESALGAAFARTGLSFQVVTKTAKRLDAPAARDAADAIRRDLEISLARLRLSRVHALLAHDAAELLGDHGEARWRAMNDARAQGLVERIGVSVYSGTVADAALARFPIDLVQAPLNVLDDRLATGGQLARLAAAGVAFHARSVFLQGLLLAEGSILQPRFREFSPVLDQLDRAAAAAGVPRLALLLGAVLRRSAVERAVVGVTSTRELAEVIAATRQGLAAADEIRYDNGQTLDERVLDPSQWSLLS